MRPSLFMLFIEFSVHPLSHWFYEDFIREENPKFPSLPLKRFSAMLFEACPVLNQWSHDHEQAFNKFLQYKTRVPVCGAIMLNDAMDKVSPVFYLVCYNQPSISYSVCLSKDGNHHLVGAFQKAKSTKRNLGPLARYERYEG